LDQEQAYSFAVFRVLERAFARYPESLERATSFFQSLNYDPTDTNLELDNPSGVGNWVGRFLNNYFRNDESNFDGLDPRSPVAGGRIPYGDTRYPQTIFFL
jgi:hypothetical protein